MNQQSIAAKHLMATIFVGASVVGYESAPNGAPLYPSVLIPNRDVQQDICISGHVEWSNTGTDVLDFSWRVERDIWITVYRVTRLVPEGEAKDGDTVQVNYAVSLDDATYMSHIAMREAGNANLLTIVPPEGVTVEVEGRYRMPFGMVARAQFPRCTEAPCAEKGAHYNYMFLVVLDKAMGLAEPRFIGTETLPRGESIVAGLTDGQIALRLGSGEIVSKGGLYGNEFIVDADNKPSFQINGIDDLSASLIAAMDAIGEGDAVPGGDSEMADVEAKAAAAREEFKGNLRKVGLSEGAIERITNYASAATIAGFDPALAFDVISKAKLRGDTDSRGAFVEYLQRSDAINGALDLKGVIDWMVKESLARNLQN